MLQMLPNRTLYPSAALAGEAPAKNLAWAGALIVTTVATPFL